jgi:uncharacterized membrane protein YkvA (DUF1232 family)
MKVTSVTTTMSAEDILHDLKEMVELKVPGLSFDSVELQNNHIEVRGNYKMAINIPFLGRVRIVSVMDNVLEIAVAKVKVLKIGIPHFILNIAAKTAVKKAQEAGIEYDDGVIRVNIDNFLQKVPHVYMKVNDITMQNNLLAVNIQNIQADIEAMQEESGKDEEEEARIEREKEAKRIEDFNRRIALLERNTDSYTDFRESLYVKTPAEAKKYFKYAMILPDIYALSFRLLKDKRVSKKDKVIITLTLGYPIFPLDILPDHLPILGALDDFALITFGVNHIMKRIPIPILVENWQGDLKTLKQIQDTMGMVVNLPAVKTLNSVYGMVDQKLEERHRSYLDDEAYLTQVMVEEPLEPNPLLVQPAPPEEV